MVDKESGKFAMNWDDELVQGTGLTRSGVVVHPSFTEGAN